MSGDTRTMDRARLADALRATASGDRQAFHLVYRLTSAKLFGVALRIFGNREEAEDIVQEVYATVWQKAAQFDPARASPITWLVTMVRNRSIDRLRSSGRKVMAPIEEVADLADDAPGALDELLDTEQSHRIGDCLAELAGPDAALIRHAFFEGSTYSELADRSATPLGTIKSRIRRALIRLRACLS